MAQFPVRASSSSPHRRRRRRTTHNSSLSQIDSVSRRSASLISAVHSPPNDPSPVRIPYPRFRCRLNQIPFAEESSHVDFFLRFLVLNLVILTSDRILFDFRFVSRRQEKTMGSVCCVAVKDRRKVPPPPSSSGHHHHAAAAGASLHRNSACSPQWSFRRDVNRRRVADEIEGSPYYSREGLSMDKMSSLGSERGTRSEGGTPPPDGTPFLKSGAPEMGSNSMMVPPSSGCCL